VTVAMPRTTVLPITSTSCSSRSCDTAAVP